MTANRRSVAGTKDTSPDRYAAEAFGSDVFVLLVQLLGRTARLAG
jgi:hypothetical protein